MKKIYCKDMGFECDFVAEGQTDEEAMAKIKEHGAQAHTEKVQEMMDSMSPEGMDTKLRANIKEE